MESGPDVEVGGLTLNSEAQHEYTRATMQQGSTHIQQQPEPQHNGGANGAPAPQHNGAGRSSPSAHSDTAQGVARPSQQLEAHAAMQVAEVEAVDAQGAGGGDVEATSSSIVLRIEYAPPLETKLITWVMVLAVISAIVLVLVIELANGLGTSPYQKAVNGEGSTTLVGNLVTGCVMSTLAGSLLGLYVFKWAWFTHFRLQWDRRRRRVVAIKAVELTALTAYLLAWTIASGTRAQGAECRTYNTRLVAAMFVRMTCFNILLLMWVTAARGMRCWRQAGSGAPGPKIVPPLPPDVDRAFTAAAGGLDNAAAGAVAAAGAAAGAALRKGHAMSLPAAAFRGIWPPATTAPHAPGTAAAPAPAPAPGPAALELSQPAERAAAPERSLSACDAAAAKHPTGSRVAPFRKFMAPEADPCDQETGDVGPGTAPSQDEELYVDAPWLIQMMTGLILFVPYQGVIIAKFVLLLKHIPGSGYDYPVGCLDWFVECGADETRQTLLTVLTVVSFVAYLALYSSQCWLAFRYLASRSYMQYRALNIALRVEVRIRGLVFVFLVAFEILEGYASPHGTESKCVVSADALVGLWPVQAVCTLLVVGLAWLLLPRAVDQGLPVMQETLQEFAWTEEELPARRAKRLASLPAGSCCSAAMQEAPMFCFETAVKLCYWSQFTYFHGEIDRAPYRVPFERLMECYDLDEIEVVYEEESDAKAVLAWSAETILVCFRGTASLKAACVDVKAYLVPYHDRVRWQARYQWASLAAVHHGFQWSWLHKGFSARVLARVRALRLAHPQAKVMVTGHSLGGAHGILCALEIMAQELFEAPVTPPIKLCCYTYGSPRVGDYSLARLYDKVVKELWNVVNQNDLVALTPKYVGWFVFKHPGHKVVAKRSGDLIVRPTYVEASVMRPPCARSVVNHMLGSYMATCMAVLHGQLHHRHMEGGLRGLVQLTRFGLPEVDNLCRMLLDQPLQGGLCGATNDPEDNVGAPKELLPSKGAPAAAPNALTLVQQASLRLALRSNLAAPDTGRRSQQPGQQARAHAHADTPIPQSQARRRQRTFLRLLLGRVGMDRDLLGVDLGADDGAGTFYPEGGTGGIGLGSDAVQLEVLAGAGEAPSYGGEVPVVPDASAPREDAVNVGHGSKGGDGGVCELSTLGPQDMESGVHGDD